MYSVRKMRLRTIFSITRTTHVHKKTKPRMIHFCFTQIAHFSKNLSTVFVWNTLNGIFTYKLNSIDRGWSVVYHEFPTIYILEPSIELYLDT